MPRPAIKAQTKDSEYKAHEFWDGVWKASCDLLKPEIAIPSCGSSPSFLLNCTCDYANQTFSSCQGCMWTKKANYIHYSFLFDLSLRRRKNVTFDSLDLARLFNLRGISSFGNFSGDFLFKARTISDVAIVELHSDWVFSPSVRTAWFQKELKCSFSDGLSDVELLIRGMELEGFLGFREANGVLYPVSLGYWNEKLMGSSTVRLLFVKPTSPVWNAVASSIADVALPLTVLRGIKDEWSDLMQFRKVEYGRLISVFDSFGFDWVPFSGTAIAVNRYGSLDGRLAPGVVDYVDDDFDIIMILPPKQFSEAAVQKLKTAVLEKLAPHGWSNVEKRMPSPCQLTGELEWKPGLVHPETSRTFRFDVNFETIIQEEGKKFVTIGNKCAFQDKGRFPYNTVVSAWYRQDNACSTQFSSVDMLPGRFRAPWTARWRYLWVVLLTSWQAIAAWNNRHDWEYGKDKPAFLDCVAWPFKHFGNANDVPNARLFGNPPQFARQLPILKTVLRDTIDLYTLEQHCMGRHSFLSKNQAVSSHEPCVKIQKKLLEGKE